MPTTKKKSKKNSKLLKISVSSDTETDNSEHELSYYAKDKVKLMKEVLKLIKPKKIKSMAPDCIKNLDIAEINSMLLEEVLGISSKRLQCIFKGENVDRETSSSESEDEKPLDVISLDDISDDEIIYISEPETEPSKSGLSNKQKLGKNKRIIKSEEGKERKKQKSNDIKKELIEKNTLLSVLELLELQARARAIRSQLALEVESTKILNEHPEVKHEESDSDAAIIIESPQRKEIVITSESDENISDKEVLNETEKQAVSVKSLIQICKESVNLEQGLNVASNLKSINEASTNFEQSFHKQISEKIIETSVDSPCEINESKKKLDEIKNKKEKIFSKIQKLKLSKKSNALSLNKNIPKNVEGKLKSESTELVEKNISTSYSNLVDNKEKTTSIPNNEIENTVEYKTKQQKLKGVSQTSSIKNVNYCDDEIVINLDDNEIDDMENN